MASVELKAVEKRFGETRIVKGLSLAVGAGELLVLVGPSGCGKTTTLRMIAGLEEASGGDIFIDGRRVNDLAPKERDIAMVFQSYALYPHLSVRENLAFGLRLRKLPEAEIAARVDEAARVLAIGPLMQRKPKELSGGQRQRVAIGRAIVRHPKVFLFDEPLSNLDAALRVQMRGEIAALHKRLGATMVYVTHDQVEAMMLATRIAVLDQGDLKQIGPPLELYRRPDDRFVAAFLGSPSMNFLDGEIVGGAFVVDGVPVRLPPAGAVPGRFTDTMARATLGVRPHDVGLAADGVKGEVTIVEPMGWETFVHVKTAAGVVVARVEGAAAAGDVRLGDRVALALDGARAHVFDTDGKAILHPVADSPPPPGVLGRAGAEAHA